MKTSLGIWALGPMVTRFVPGGYQPERAGETTVDRVRRAVDGLGDLIDDYEFHYPQELSEENLDAVREALGGHDVYCIATGLHLDPLVTDECGNRAVENVERLVLAGVRVDWRLVAGAQVPFHDRPVAAGLLTLEL